MIRINIRSTGPEVTKQIKMTSDQLINLFGNGYAEEIKDGWEVRHPTKPYLKYSAI